MPIYEYQCQECGQRTEELQRLDDPPLKECRQCGGPMRKLVSAPAFQFKGSGWYVTDYAGKGGGGDETGGEPKKSDSKGGESKDGESKDGDSKPAAAKDGDSKSAAKASSGGGKKAATD